MTPDDEALVARLPPGSRAENGVPDDHQTRMRAQAAALAAGALGELLRPGGLRVSPLGAGWSTDIDLHLNALPAPELLQDLGWLCLDRLLQCLGSGGEGRWAILQDGHILAAADLHLSDPPDPVKAVLDRCRRRREVRAREVLELRALLREGAAMPSGDPALSVAARVERGLGGDALASWADDGSPLPAPAPLPWGKLVTQAARLRPHRRARLVVAISGVDGAGKSTLSRTLEGDLAAAGVPVTSVWTRPGLRLRWLEILARLAKRVLRQDSAPGITQVAEGDASQTLASRRGMIGWVWALLVTLSFLVDVRRSHLRGRGVMIYDRHLLDALATLDFGYEGVDLRLQRALVRRLLPRAALTVYLDIPAFAAVARKPGDMFGEHAVSRQLDVYAKRLEEVAGLRILDATRPQEDLAFETLRLLIAGG